MLLFEYYVFKIKHKEQERELKLAKAIAEYLRKSMVKLTKDTQLEQIAPLIDEKSEFASAKLQVKQKALELAIKETLRREKQFQSESSSYDSRHGGGSK